MSRTLRDYRGVFRPVGAVVMGLGAAIGLCGLVGFAFDVLDPLPDPRAQGGEWALALTAAATAATGLGLFFYGARHKAPSITRREAILSVGMIWLAAGLFGAVPFVIGAEMSPVDGLFESISGLTTTGATVIPDVEHRLTRPLLLWRSLTQWLGGMGIVVLFVAVFPNIGASGKYMFGEEVPGTSAEGLRPRIAETSRVLWQFYAAFTLLEVGVLYLLDVSLFEAICHALTTMSTGGFSTRDASIAAFESAAVELTIAGFMVIAGVNFALYYAIIRTRSLKALFRSVELRAYLGIIAGATAVVTFGILDLHGGDLFEAFRHAFFQVVTFITSTGYGTDAYMAYPPVILYVILMLMFLGGSSGSTAGGIKVERLVLMMKMVWTEVRRSFRPSLVHVVRMGRTVVQPTVLTDVAVFFIIYMLAMAVGTAAVTAIEGAPIPTAFGAVLSSLSNMGPAPFHIGPDLFVHYSAPSKVIFAALMVLGRLEFFAILALFVPGFWKR